MALTVSKIDLDASDASFAAAFDGAVQSARRELAQTEFVRPVVVLDPAQFEVRPADMASDQNAAPAQGAGFNAAAIVTVETVHADNGVTVSVVALEPSGDGTPQADFVVVDSGDDAGGALITTVKGSDGTSTTVIIALDDEGAPVAGPALVVSSDDQADAPTAFGFLGATQDDGERSLLLIVPEGSGPDSAIIIATAGLADEIDPAAAFTNGGIISTGSGFTTSRFGGAVEIKVGDRSIVVWLDAGRAIGGGETGTVEGQFGLLAPEDETSASVSSEVRLATLRFDGGRLVAIEAGDREPIDLNETARQFADSLDPAPGGGYQFDVGQSLAVINKLSQLSGAIEGDSQLLRAVTDTIFRPDDYRDNQMVLRRQDQERALELGARS